MDRRVGVFFFFFEGALPSAAARRSLVIPAPGRPNEPPGLQAWLRRMMSAPKNGPECCGIAGRFRSAGRGPGGLPTS